MVSTLPNEILIKIFQQLHPLDQMECMLVCHRWNQLIEDSALYHTVFLFSSASLKKLLQKIQQRPDIATRIERLYLRIIEKKGGYKNSNKLLMLTPNLKVLFHSTPTVLKNNTQYPWRNQIEYIVEDTSENITDYFFSSDAYPNVKAFSYCYYDKYHPLIKNVSGLTSLVLKEVTLGFDDLEEIHKNAPHLKSLKFSTLDYYGGGNFSEKAITPATTVTEFIAHVDMDTDVPEDFSHPELHAELLVYISRKYPNLSTLEYRYRGDNGLDASDVRQISKMGWNPLLQRLGPQLKKVTVWLSSAQDELAEAFDRFGCQLNYLHLPCKFHESLVKIAQSKQACYIQTLVLSIKLPSLDWLKHFHVLKKLKLDYYLQSRKIQLSDILDNAPPTLESLSLHARSFDIDPTYTGTSNIKTLSFRAMRFDDKVNEFISQCFPQLSELELRECELQNNRLKLEKTDLASFFYYNNFNHVLLVTTLRDNKQRSYTSYNINYGTDEVFYPQNYRTFKTYPASDVNDSVSALDFTCNSVRNVVFTE